MSNSSQEQLRKNSSTIGPPAGTEPTPLRCRCNALTTTVAQKGHPSKETNTKRKKSPRKKKVTPQIKKVTKQIKKVTTQTKKSQCK
jgi:hypothetical protein